MTPPPAPDSNGAGEHGPFSALEGLRPVSPGFQRRNTKPGPTPLSAPLHRRPDDLRWAARHWATRIGVKLTQIHVRPMRSKWASMSTAGRLTLNTDLLTIPTSLAEYVVVHELVHLLAPNHGKVFKSFLTAYLPDWQDRDKQLRELAGTLFPNGQLPESSWQSDRLFYSNGQAVPPRRVGGPGQAADVPRLGRAVIPAPAPFQGSVLSKLRRARR